MVYVFGTKGIKTSLAMPLNLLQKLRQVEIGKGIVDNVAEDPKIIEGTDDEMWAQKPILKAIIKNCIKEKVFLF